MNGNIPEAAKKRLDSLFDAFSLIAEGTYVYLCDMRYDYSRWSKAAVEKFALPSEYMYVAGQIWEEHIHPEDRAIYNKAINDIFSGNSDNHDMQYRAKRQDGEYDVCTCRGIVIHDEMGNPEYFAGIIRDHGIQGHVDALTGLKNQYSFFEDLRSYILSRISARIIMIGVARFTEINEVYGYRVGNTVLQKLGRYILEDVNNKGNVYKLDGTRFAIISHTKSDQSINDSYERMRAFFRKGLSAEDKKLLIEFNAGMFLLDGFEIDDQTAYSCLNYAYTESKVRRQGDLVVFNDALNIGNKTDIEKLHAIRASITQDYEGFYLLYQPFVDAQTEEILGAEALIRWKNDEYGVVPPDLFIPMIEMDPIFPDLGLWILKTALTDAMRMLEKKPDFILNVNLSYSQLEKPDFADRVLDMLERMKYPAENLCLEITERCRLLDIGLLRNIITKLRSRGIQIALDDFGTGFSSMGIARAIPIDTIKIDKSFIKDIENSTRDQELVGHFSRFAGVLGAVICIEGVETAGMRDILKRYRIHSFQGYYYSKPITIEELIEWRC